MNETLRAGGKKTSAARAIARAADIRQILALYFSLLFTYVR